MKDTELSKAKSFGISAVAYSKLRCGELSVEIVGNLLWGRYLSHQK